MTVPKRQPLTFIRKMYVDMQVEWTQNPHQAAAELPIHASSIPNEPLYRSSSSSLVESRLLVVKCCWLVGHKETEARYQRTETTQVPNSAQQGRECQSLLRPCSYEGHSMPEDWSIKWIKG